MSKIYLVIIILVDFIFLLSSYFLILNRLKYINNRHITHTQVKWISVFTNRLLKIISILFLVLFIFSIFIIITFL